MSSRKYDVVFRTPFEEKGFMLMPDDGQDRSWKGSFGPAELMAEIAKSRDIPLTWMDFSAGMGFSETWGRGVNGYAYGQNVYTRSPRLLLPGPYIYTISTSGITFTGPVTDSQVWEGSLRFCAGDKLLSLASSSTTAVVENTFAGSSFQSMQEFRGGGQRALYVTDRNSQMIRRLPGAGYIRLTDPGVGNNPRLRFSHAAQVYWAVGDKRGYQMLLVDMNDPTGGSLSEAHMWHVAADPSNYANYSGPVAIGSGAPVKSIAASNRRAYYCNRDGVYDLDEQGYSPNLTPYWADYPSDSNGAWSTVYSGMVLASHQLGLDWVPVGSGARMDASTFAHPGSGLPNETPCYGPVTAGVNDGGWMAVAQFNGRDSYISYGKPRNMIGIDGPGAFLWHNEIFLAGVKVTHMTIQTRFDGPMLLMFCHLTDAPTAVRIYECTIPTSSSPLQDWLNGGRHRFSERFSLVLPTEDWGEPAARKNLMRLDIQADALGQLADGTAVQLELLARTEMSDWLSQGSTAVSPRGIIYPKGKYLDGYRIGLQIVGSGRTSKGANNEYELGGTSYPPIMRALRARAGLVVEQRKTVIMRIALGARLRDDSIDKRPVNELEDWLYSLQNYGPIEMKDDDGDWRTVKVEAGSTFAEQEHPTTSTKVTVTEVIASFIEEEFQPPTAPAPSYTGPVWDGTGEWGDATPRTNDINWQ